MKRFIPNTITSMNLLCGVIGVVCAFKGNIPAAFLFMIGGAVFDFCDGFAARALGAYSDMGKELDSLSDDVTFGVLPAVMLFLTMNGAEWYCYIPLLLAVFSGLRLAKFNVDERQHSSFIGLPTPACAILCGGLCSFVKTAPDGVLASLCASVWFIPALSLVLCALLVCELPMFSMKFGKADPRPLKIKRILFFAVGAISLIICAVFHLNWTFAAFSLFGFYIIENIFCAILHC